jgi:hypothetical protein
VLSKKAERMRWQFEKFAERLQLYRNDFKILEDTSNDPPDIAIGGNDIGIEFVNFYHGSANPADGSDLKHTEETFKKIVADAEKRFLEICDIPLHVAFRWRKELRPNRRQRAEIVEAIVNTVRSSIPAMTNAPIKFTSEELVGTGLEAFLDLLWISRILHGISTWSNNDGGNINAGIDVLEAYVRYKEKDLPRYRNRFREVWLVIAAPNHSVADSIYPLPSVKPGCIESKFARVYLHDYLHNSLILLTVDTN